MLPTCVHRAWGGRGFGCAVIATCWLARGASPNGTPHAPCACFTGAGVASINAPRRLATLGAPTGNLHNANPSEENAGCRFGFLPNGLCRVWVGRGFGCAVLATFLHAIEFSHKGTARALGAWFTRAGVASINAPRRFATICAATGNALRGKCWMPLWVYS